MAPTSRSLVILKEYRLIVCDEDEGTQIGWIIGQITGQISIGVPKLESHFVFRPSINEGLSIGHNIVSFMPVNIHPVLLFAVVLP